jgi:hypothetical protein
MAKDRNDLMRFDAASRSVPVSHTEKEAKLKAFIVTSTEAARGHADCLDDVSLVARGTDSPAALALASFLKQHGTATTRVRIVLFDIDGIVEDNIAHSILDIPHADVCVVTDARFAAAHEQLVVANEHVWIGDCMRRDPLKRDAFEMTFEPGASGSRHAASSFEKMWQSSKPLPRSVGKNLAPVELAAIDGKDADTATDSTHTH